MPRPDPKRVALAYHKAIEAAHLMAVLEDGLAQSRKTGSHKIRTAGEVRFIKDRSGDSTEWAWNSTPPEARQISSEYVYDVKNLEPLTRSLRAILSALGFAMSGYTTFTKAKSAQISPDGSLGGKGYIMKIPDMRRQLMNCIEVLSALTDTMYDEVNASHWHPKVEGAPDKRERVQVQEIMNDVEDIKKDPEGFAKGEESEMDDEDEPGTQKLSMKLASAYLRVRRAP